MDDHMLQNQISMSQKLCLHRPEGKEQAQELLKRFEEAFPEIKQMRVLVFDSVDYSAIERGIAAHEAIEAIHSTPPCVIGIDLAVGDDVGVFTVMLKKLSEKRMVDYDTLKAKAELFDELVDRISYFEAQRENNPQPVLLEFAWNKVIDVYIKAKALK
jgi:hypothetical protein